MRYVIHRLPCYDVIIAHGQRKKVNPKATFHFIDLTMDLTHNQTTQYQF